MPTAIEPVVDIGTGLASGAAASRLGQAGRLAQSATAKTATIAPGGGLGGLVTDLGSGIGLTARQLSTQANQIWGLEALAVLLSNVSNARRVGHLIRGSERILQRHVARISAAHPGISSRSLGTLVGRAAERDILKYAERLGLRAIAEHRLPLPDGLLGLADEGLASFRIADIALPNQKLAIELTLESAQEVAKLSLHKQGQLADFYLAGFRPIIVTPH